MAQQGGSSQNIFSNVHGFNSIRICEEPMEIDFTFMGSTPSNQQNTMDSEVDQNCPICLDTFTNVKILDKCSHKFCGECIDMHFKYKPQCPTCFTVYGHIYGNQPYGDMDLKQNCNSRLPGYEQHGTIQLSYYFADGTQTSEHPNPGQYYYGTSRVAYLPNNQKGQTVARLLRVAFDRRLLFTIGRSRTTGMDNCVTWNDVHHKTSPNGGPENFGYPDPTYLDRVLEELAAKGVTEQDLNASNVMEKICRR